MAKWFTVPATTFERAMSDLAEEFDLTLRISYSMSSSAYVFAFRELRGHRQVFVKVNTLDLDLGTRSPEGILEEAIRQLHPT